MTKIIIAIIILPTFGFVFLLYSSALRDYGEKGHKRNMEILGLTKTFLDKPPAEWQFILMGLTCMVLAIIICVIVIFKK